MTRILSFFLLTLCFAFVSNAQDKLLLTNGKIKKLKGRVVYYDYNDIFYQSEKAKAKMKEDSSKIVAAQIKLESSDRWKRKQEKTLEWARRKKNKQEEKISQLRANFESKVDQKKTDLSFSEFENWKEKELAAIKELEVRYQLYWALREGRVNSRYERIAAKLRGKHTRSSSRSKVFSILREDGTEEVVYNADTLGLLADGEYEVEYGVEDMRLYIKGRQDGRKHSFHDVYIGAATGLGSGLVFTYTLDMFYAPIAPAICIAVIAGLNNFKPNPKLELTKALLDSDPYMDGYIKSAKGRKIFAFTVGAIGGLGVGIGTAVATSPLLQ